jgi:hypothetical protein
VKPRRPPRLVIELELERDLGIVLLFAESAEDERRLRMWLRYSAVFRTLPAMIDRLLDDLDRLDEERAA